MTKICFILTILSTTILIHTTVICQGNFNSFWQLSSIFSFLTLQSILKLKSFSDFKNKSDHYYTVYPADSPTMARLPQGSPQWAPPSPLCSVLWGHRPPLRALLPPSKEPLSETPSSSSYHIPHMITQHLHLSWSITSSGNPFFPQTTSNLPSNLKLSHPCTSPSSHLEQLLFK